MARTQSRYLGVQPFKTSDRHLFFGRDDDIESLHDFILLEKLVVLFGKSGYGKSSLLNAGIVPRLADKQQPNTFQFQPIEVRFTHYINEQSHSPLDTLNNLLKETALDPESGFLDGSAEGATLWGEFKRRQTATGGRFVLLFDQFEEFFSYPPEQQEVFRRQLAELLYTDIPRSIRDRMDDFKPEQRRFLTQPMNIKAVFAIRSDRMSYLDGMKDVLPAILHKRFELRPLSPSQARDAIVRPASIPGEQFSSPPFEYSAGGLQAILHALTDKNNNTQGNSTGIEAFQLQIICEYIERRVREGLVPDINQNGLPDITEDQLPDMDTLYENYYHRKLHELPSENRALAQRVLEDFLLAEDPVTGEGRRKSVDILDLKQTGISESILNDLEKTYLIRREINTVQGFSFEISHDTLVLPIQKARRERLYAEEQERLIREQKEKENQLTEARRLAAVETRRRRLATFLTIISAIGLLVAIWFYFDAENAKKRAWEAQKEAENAKADALNNLYEAKRQQKLAEQKTLEAEAAKNDALYQKTFADKKSREAQAALHKMQEAQADKNRMEIAKYLNSADRMIALGKYPVARQILAEALKLDKNNPDILQKLKEISGK